MRRLRVEPELPCSFTLSLHSRLVGRFPQDMQLHRRLGTRGLPAVVSMANSGCHRIGAVALGRLSLPGMWLAFAIRQIFRAIKKRGLELVVGLSLKVLHVFGAVFGRALHE